MDALTAEDICHVDLGDAFRAPRAQLLSRAIGEHIYHPAGEHARLRNAIMGAKTSEDYYNDLAWLYGGTGLKG